MGNYLIIGGSSGIGEEIVKNLAKEKNNHIIATYKSNKKLNTENITYREFNTLEEELDIEFIPDNLDGLIYCPGSINLKPFKRFKEKDFIEDYMLQVVGAIKIIKSIYPKLVSGNGSIVLFSTIAVQQGFNFHSLVATSKGAIEGLTKSLAAEFAPNVRVNCIAPSLTKTKLSSKILSTDEKIELYGSKNPLKRVGEAQDIANLACFLVSANASWINGQIIHIDGGQSTIK